MKTTKPKSAPDAPGQPAISALGAVTGSAAPLTLEQAIIRYSVVSEKWGEFAAGSAPYLNAFLAGWCSRSIGMTEPSDRNIGRYRASFLSGWNEAETFAEIWKRQQTAETTQSANGDKL